MHSVVSPSIVHCHSKTATGSRAQSDGVHGKLRASARVRASARALATAALRRKLAVPTRANTHLEQGCGTASHLRRHLQLERRHPAAVLGFGPPHCRRSAFFHLFAGKTFFLPFLHGMDR